MIGVNNFVAYVEISIANDHSGHPIHARRKDKNELVQL